MDDLRDAIEEVKSFLFGMELESFERIVDRLEGYELAYSVIVEENERLKEENDTIPQLQERYMILKESHDLLVQKLKDKKL